MNRLSKKAIENWKIILDNLNRDELVFIKKEINKIIVDKFDD